MEAGTTAASRWSIRQLLEKLRELAEHGRKIAALMQEMGTLRERVAAHETQLADLQRRAVPADPEVDETLQVMTALVGGKRHNFCPVCWGKGQFMLLQHEPKEEPPWRCPECHLCFPGGRTRSIPMVSDAVRGPFDHPW